MVSSIKCDRCRCLDEQHQCVSHAGVRPKADRCGKVSWLGAEELSVRWLGAEEVPVRAGTE